MPTDGIRLQLIRIVGLSILGLLIMLTYSVARPATESLFLAAHGSTALPVVWILMSAVMIATIVYYNRLVLSLDLLHLYRGASLLSGLSLIGLLVSEKLSLPGVYYGLYIWKDIYIILLIEIFYSFANAVFPVQTARWIYGFFGAISTLGSFVGNMAVGVVAERYGTLQSLWILPPLLLMMWLGCIPFSRLARAQSIFERKKQPPDVLHAIRVIQGSSYLLFVLLLIAVIQVVITLVDYDFNSVIEIAFPTTDQRTKIIGWVYAAISVATLVLHGLTGPLLHLFGVPLTMLAIPLLLGTGVLTHGILPRFETIAGIKIASKSFDYSIFRAAKEILYIPLSYEEITLGKSLIDMVTYRLAKAAASIFLLVLLSLQASRWVTLLNLLLIATWFALTLPVVRRFRRQIAVTTSEISASSRA